ncbi:hypothetical protein [Mucilaginibacter dorajii]|uniref:Uncharacterized protein n=1 Tax=Mucilaginibacter dorajii TaxID=692994 RepID=A0ABP7Q0U2_9SPHI|nr:hypothetical protein [Mucilaginibacter dorajii]MCS3732977.1 putative transcriptional regulator [Mucilaginibacter dorajii]
MKENNNPGIVFPAAPEASYVQIDEQALPLHVLDGITKGQADIKAGRIISLEEFKKRLSSAK